MGWLLLADVLGVVMEATKKLIQDGRWRPIEEATPDDLKKQLIVRLPRNNGKYGITTAIYIGKHEMTAEDWNWEDEDTIDYADDGTEYVPAGWFEQTESNIPDYGWFLLSKNKTPTHFYCAPDNRLADALEGAVSALWSIGKTTEIAWGQEQSTDEANKAIEALAKIEQIAKGECDDNR